MSVVLKNDNRQLTANSKYSYLVNNESSGVSSFTLVNTEGAATDSFILVEDVGMETSEIFRIGSVDASTKIITLQTAAGVATTTNFAHPESSKIYFIPYNQVRFYWTAATGTIADETPTFSSSNPLSAWVDVEPDGWYTTYTDNTNSSGFGWIVLRNSVSLIQSSYSNPIPYASFAENTVAVIFDSVNSMLNTNELRIITPKEKMYFLNEGLAMLVNKLNLSNTEYTVSDLTTITTVPGTAEYLLQPDFSDVVDITTEAGTAIPFCPVSNVLENNGRNPQQLSYYLRGRYIGFSATPSTVMNIKYRYKRKGMRVTSLSDYISLPDNATYALVDWCLFRIFSKFNNPIAATYYASFKNAVDLYIQSSVQRSADRDSWNISLSQNT
jgi:hypothetical protein